MIAKYLNIKDMSFGSLACPKDSPPEKYMWISGNWGNCLRTSYGGSDFVFFEFGKNIKLSKIPISPSRIFSLADGHNHIINEWNQRFHSRHGRGVNMAWVDGHVSYYKLERVPHDFKCGVDPYKYPVQTNYLKSPWGGTHP